MFDIVMLFALKDAARVVSAETGWLSGCDRYINNSCADFRQSYRRLLNPPFSTSVTN
jgi:hypothetical protein